MKAHRTIIALLIVAFTLTACQKDESNPVSGENLSSSVAWVVNSLSSTLSHVDLATDSITVNVLAIGQYANDIVIADSTGYVVNSGDNQIQILNLQTGQTSGAIEIYLGMNPWAIAVNNQFGYVTNLMTGNLSILDLTTLQEIDTLHIGVSPEGVCIYENVLYVTDVNLNWPTYGQGYVHAYSLPDLSHLAAIPVATNPQVVIPGPDGLIHVVCTGDFNTVSGKVQLINPVAMSVVGSIDIGSSPGSLAFTQQGIGYLGASTMTGSGEVLSYNGITREIIHGANNPISLASGVWDVAVTNSSHVLACCFGADQLVELDANGNQLKIYTVGDGPVAVALLEP